ncbi:MAG TPA: SPOR domain-containing protein [Haliangiales bacterium]|nr:SPOR domain-containing protein [Haliangiales bacterium]
MTLRDADRFKDKLEVHLDNRQIFALFFGGAVVACLVFVLGVMVGRRIEARERVAAKAATSATVDPLAALDELGADEKADEALAFPTALAGGKSPDAVVPPPAPEKVEAKPAEKPAEAKAVKPEKKPEPEKDKKKKFTLQISSFQDKSEADALVAKLAAAGYKPYVILSEVEGKGTFFRVRIGEYRSKSDASDAKEAFERKQRIIAYVTKM